MNALIKIDSNVTSGGLLETLGEVILGPIIFDKEVFVSKIKESNLSLTNSNFPDIPWEDSFDESSMIPISLYHIDSSIKFVGFQILKALDNELPVHNSDTHTIAVSSYVIEDEASGITDLEGSKVVDLVRFTYEVVLR
jgi:hypothetical protein